MGQIGLHVPGSGTVPSLPVGLDPWGPVYWDWVLGALHQLYLALHLGIELRGSALPLAGPAHQDWALGASTCLCVLGLGSVPPSKWLSARSQIWPTGWSLSTPGLHQSKRRGSNHGLFIWI